MNRRKEKELERRERRVQRDEREKAAGKLLQRVPDLASLDIAIHETRPQGSASDNHYIRRIVLEHAPALFEIPCSNPDCEDGGYEVTFEMLSALGSHTARFEGRHACRGHCGPLDCGRILRYVATATYREEQGAGPRGRTVAAT